MSDNLDLAIMMAERAIGQLEKLAEVSRKIPVINVDVLEWLSLESGDIEAAKILKLYSELYAQYENLKVSSENIVSANVWHGTKSAKLRKALQLGLDSLKDLSVEDPDVAGDEDVAKAIARIEEKLKGPNTQAASPTKGETLDDRVRAWAKEKGWPVGQRGAVSKVYKQAYEEAGLA